MFYMTISYNITECAICLSDLSEIDIVAICNKCNRPFCTNCIYIQELYFENNNITPSCPTCRRNNISFSIIEKDKYKRSIFKRLFCCANI